MFIQPCYIKKNTEVLRRSLEQLGYGYSKAYDKPTALKCLRTRVGIQPLYFLTVGYPDVSGIDCGENNDLFLAIAALRGDSDIYQWFITNKEEWFISFYHKQHTHLCNRKICNIDIGERTARKATVQELIEHFKER